MGSPEFSTSLAEFNQAQIDAIETAVNTVKTSVNDIKTTDLAGIDTQVDAIRVTDLPAINTNVNGIKTTDLPNVKAVVDAIRATDVANIQANINQIPLVSAVDWASKSFQTSAVIDVHQAVTHLDIIGSGYLNSIFNFSTTTIYYGIQIDGGSIYLISGNPSALSLFPIRFNTSLKVTSNSNPAGNRAVWAVLD
jgi:hypothetical protein